MKINTKGASLLKTSIVKILLLLPSITQQANVVPDTIDSVTKEVADLQSKLDNILYPAYYKDLNEAFGSVNYIFGGHDKLYVKDDVLKFHEIPAH